MDDIRTLIADMHQPARCRYCGRVYDLGKVTITARYIDCSMWKAPCCGTTVDDRGETGWKSIQDYERIDKNNPYGLIGPMGRSYGPGEFGRQS